jgi:hypothetical protein
MARKLQVEIPEVVLTRPRDDDAILLSSHDRRV